MNAASPAPGAVALPMYDWPETRAATDALWSAWRARLTERGVATPPALDHDRAPEAVWRDPDLLLAQTCGAPWVAGAAPGTTLLATPRYAAPGCEGPRYCSWILVRADDPANAPEALMGRRAAVNDYGSLSGWLSLRAIGLRPGETLVTGAHRASARAVAEGRADFAALDAVVWALLRRHEPAVAAALRPLGRTPSFPAPPFIAGRRRGADTVAKLRQALLDTLADPASRAARDALLLGGAEVLAPEAYDPIRPLLQDGRRHALVNA